MILNAVLIRFYVGFVDLVELRKQSSCSMQLANRTDQYIAFKVSSLSYIRLKCLLRCLKV